MESLKLIKKFWEFNNQESLGSSTIAVYFYLIEQWDKNDKNDFSLSDKQVSSVLKLSRKTVKTAKDTLRNLGLLSYKSIAGFPCVYKLITDYEFNEVAVVDNKKAIVKKKETPKPKTEPKPQKSQKQLPTINTGKKENKLLADIPTEEEFLQYAKSLEIYNGNSPDIDFKIKTKYESWKDNGWKNGHDKPIRNWKITLKSTLPYLLTGNSFTEKVPKINRPKSTYNE